jgi:hypothetical protein
MNQRRSLLLGLAILCSSAATQAANLILDLGNGTTVPYLISTARDVSIAPGTGNITLRLVQSAGTAGDGWCPTGSGGPNPPVITSFIVSPGSVNVGGTVSATWSTTNATSCSTTASVLAGTVSNWPATVGTSSSGLSMVLPTAGSYAFRLQCEGPGGTSAVSTSTVTVTDPGDPNCNGVNPVPGTTRMVSFTNTNALRTDGNTEWPAGTVLAADNYSPVWGPAFPSRSGTGAIPLLNGQYAAMAFNTGTSTGSSTPWGGTNFGGLNWTQPQNNGGGTATVAISECQGDFSERLPDPVKCFAQGNTGSMGFIIGTTGNRCPLALNKTYYLNIGFFNLQGQQTCGANNMCHFFGQPN